MYNDINKVIQESLPDELNGQDLTEFFIVMKYYREKQLKVNQMVLDLRTKIQEYMFSEDPKLIGAIKSLLGELYSNNSGDEVTKFQEECHRLLKLINDDPNYSKSTKKLIGTLFTGIIFGACMAAVIAVVIIHFVPFVNFTLGLFLSPVVITGLISAIGCCLATFSSYLLAARIIKKANKLKTLLVKLQQHSEAMQNYIAQIVSHRDCGNDFLIHKLGEIERMLDDCIKCIYKHNQSLHSFCKG